MFRTEQEEHHSFGAWVTQLILSTMLPSLLAAIAESKVESLNGGHPLGRVGPNAWFAVVVWSIAFGLALLVNRAFPRAAFTGLNVWILPTCVFLLAFISNAFSASFGKALSTFICPGSDGEAWWVVILVTYPTTTAVVYSLGMVFATRAGRRR